jgi:AraC-like DNA-binding protein
MSRLDSIADWEIHARGANYSVAKLAQNVGVSRRQLDRYFTNVLGSRPKAWLDDLKMEDALQLIRSGMIVKEVALQLGFKHATHFSRGFRRLRGTTLTAHLVTTRRKRPAAVDSKPATLSIV